MEKRAAWELKKELLHKKGDLYSVWECQWEQYKVDHPEIMGTITKFPHIMHRTQSEIGLMNAIKGGSFYGFVYCDLW